MARTNIFVSYSHADQSWAERVRLHLAVLQRRGLVDVWSDRRIRIGSDWRAEINRALTEAKVAVLMVSPNFLASKFIWDQEMPIIVNHLANGMIAFPLIARPCAWQLEPLLASLQARPNDDRAMSEGSESEIDFNLSRFVYELANELDIAAESGEERIGSVPPAETRRFFQRANDSGVEVWEGAYGSDRPLRLVIMKRSGGAFEGRLEYRAEGTVTVIEGETQEHWSSNESPWSEVVERGNVKAVDTAMTFRESRYQKRGSQPIEFGGSYHLLQIGDRLLGAWFSDGRKFGRIELVKQSI